MNPRTRPARLNHASLRARGLGRLIVLLGVTCAFMLSFASSAFAANPDHVNFTLEGCRLPIGATLPASIVCPDANYTTGNLGKSWNELDLVPYRITAGSGGPTQTYTIAAALDAFDAGHPGYDVISSPVLNLAHSTSAAACQMTLVSPEKIMTPGMGGIDQTRYREWTIHQTAGATCVWDYYGRLAIGSHLFSGSSLHANKALVVDATHITTSGIGASDVSIPVKEISPQTISKDMAANQGSAYSWSVSKSSSPGQIPFGNTCATTDAQRTADVTITVTYTRNAPAANGDITITTHVYATNPAARVITVGIVDKTYKGAGQAAVDLIDTADNGAGVDVPANTSNFLVLTRTKTVASGTASSFNDVATATYTDKVTGIPVTGTATATKSANLVIDNNATSASATISDTEQITQPAGQTGLSFSSDSPAGGSFSGYTAGDHTTGPITWTSNTVSGSGSVVFHKKVYLDQPRTTTGTLSDTAGVNLIGNPNAATATASTTISSELACGQITIIKDANPNDAQDFGFTASTAQSTTISPFPLDDDSNATLQNTRTFTGLKPGTYSVAEDANPSGWTLTGLTCDDNGASSTSVATRTAGIVLPKGGSVNCTYTNTKDASVTLTKVTNPVSDPATFGFSSTGSGLDASSTLDTDPSATNPNHVTKTLTAADLGAHSFTEAAKAGWTLTDVSCTGVTESVQDRTASFTVVAGADINCTYTNTKRGHVVIDKVTHPAGDEQLFDYSGDLPGAASFKLADQSTPKDVEVEPGTYHVTEAGQSGWDLTGLSCSDQGDEGGASSVEDATATIDIQPGETVTCTYTNTKRAIVTFKKVTVPAETDSETANSFEFTPSASLDADQTKFNLKHGQSKDYSNLLPGDHVYSAVESPKGGYRLTGVSCDSESGSGSKQTRTATVSPAPGEHVTCTFENTRISTALLVVKVGAPDVVHDNDPIKFTYSVSNPASSNGSLTITSIADDKCDSIEGPLTKSGGNQDDLLDPGETWTYTCTATAKHAQEDSNHVITNTVTVTGKDEFDNTLTAKDDDTTLVIHPAIAIDKTGPATAQAGDKVGYVLTVTNPGDTPLTDPSVKVSDEQCNGDPVTLLGKGGDGSTGTLDPGDTWTYSCSVQTAVGDNAVHNTGSVTGCDQIGGCVNATDSADTTLTQPEQLVLPERIVPGTAKLSGPTGCVAKAFNARIRGTKIATVTFVLDGKVVKRVKNTKNATLIQLRVNPAKMRIGVHRLVVNVTFQSGSGTKPKTTRLSFQRCAKKLAAPRFTG